MMLLFSILHYKYIYREMERETDENEKVPKHNNAHGILIDFKASIYSQHVKSHQRA